jgi:hypothetical protein
MLKTEILTRDRRSAVKFAAPIAEEFQIVFHFNGGFRIDDSYQPTDFFANRRRLLIAYDDAGVAASLPKEFRMKPVEIRRIVSEQCTPLIGSPNQLLLVRTPQDPPLPTGGDIPSAMPQSV